MSLLLTQVLTAFFVTLAALAALALLAPRIGLVDNPQGRKQHSGPVPLVGGIGIFFTLCLGASIWGEMESSMILVKGQNALWILLGCCGFLVLTGALDDRFQIGVLIRVVSEVLVAMAIIEMLDLRLVSIGDLLGHGDIRMPASVSYIFTVVAIFGLMNAFNMLDGIDGLLACMVIATIVSFHLLTTITPGPFSLFFMSALAAFLISNLKLSPLIPKTFLGDAGSKLLGFLVVCLLLAAASGQFGGEKLIKPVTALYLVTLPLFDMAFTSLRRIVRKGSPFAADRSHIHHLFFQLGFSGRRTLVLIVSLNLSAAILGLLLHRIRAPEYYQFGIFVAAFLLYSLLASQAWIVADKIVRYSKATPNPANITGTTSEASSSAGKAVFRLTSHKD